MLYIWRNLNSVSDMLEFRTTIRLSTTNDEQMKNESSEQSIYFVKYMIVCTPKTIIS